MKTRRVEFGWIHNGKMVRKRLGGGNRKADVSRTAERVELLNIGKSLYFPDGKSTKGPINDFDNLDYKETPLPENVTVSDCYELFKTGIVSFYLHTYDDDDEFRFNDASTHEGHLRQNGELTWFCNETIIMISHKCIKCKTRTNLKIKAVILC